MTDTPPPAPTDPRVPVTLLTGFLGAGKTTLLNRVLEDASDGKVAVIVNEFGEAGLDHDLIQSVEDEVVLMQSGCLCCSVRGELPETIARLLDRREAGALQFERIVIETTGMANPGPILKIMMMDTTLSRHTRVDGVVTLVDAVNGATTLDAQFEAVSQVALADLILISKTDLASEPKNKALTERLRALNETAPILHPVLGELPPNTLWNLTSVREDIAVDHALAWTTPQPADPFANLSGLSSSTPMAEPAPLHDQRIGSVSVVLEHPLTDAAFDLWLNTLTALRGNDLLRVKGIVFLEGLDIPFVFHGVQQVFERPVPLRSWRGSDRRSRIVVIARDMTRPELMRSLDMLRATQPQPQET
ncbi:CobW family GTP-binding protein [Dinoroseobacter sp. S124A]|uniref:CobW family GTP-binding protein n=2 Tax=Dinoroseobacter sp. S124A TaxID=3415128 RepID=UPI003C7D5DED